MIKEEELKDMFPDKHFIMTRIKGQTFVNSDCVDLLVKNSRKEVLKEVEKMIDEIGGQAITKTKEGQLDLLLELKQKLKEVNYHLTS